MAKSPKSASAKSPRRAAKARKPKSPETFNILNETRGFNDAKRFHLPHASLFAAVKDFTLGKKYELSLALVSKPTMRRINRIYHDKDKPTNILSFPLTETTGEIFICPAVIRPSEMLPLFIHGLVHLKGFDHGSTMEREEVKIRRKFGVSP